MMNLKNLFKTAHSENYLKNSSPLVTALLIIAGICYALSKQYGGYAAIVVLILALLVMLGQKLMLAQINKDFNDMQMAKQQFEHSQNTDYLKFIQLRANQILTDNKVLSEKGKTELHQLLSYAEEKLTQKNISYKAVFSDIDGTLLTSQHNISPKTASAIKKLIEKNIPFIPVSARPPYAITPYMQQLGCQQAIICYSGALILDKNLTALYSVELAPQDLQKIQEILNDFNSLSISYYAGLDWFTNDVENQWIQQENQITGLTASPMPKNVNKVHKILLMAEAERIQHLEQILKQNLPYLSIHRSKNEYLEIMDQSASKAKAIQFMEKHLNINQQDIIAFGDNFNDADMLQYAGLSVAMGNAPEEIKQMAKQVTASNDEDGIALVLNKIYSL